MTSERPKRASGPSRVSAAPERRKALSHVGGRVLLRGGGSATRDVLRSALSVSSDEAETRRHVHGFHPYPARLHPDTARRLISGLSAQGGVVLDPFCGSGTVLVEARELGRCALGVDANPLSVALSRFKVEPGAPQVRGAWLRAAYAVAKLADADRRGLAEAPRQYTQEDQELFSPRTFQELAYLRRRIADLKDEPVRGALLLIFSSVLNKVGRRVDDGGSKGQVAERPSGFAIRFFRERAGEVGRQVAAYAARLPEVVPPAEVVIGDARELASISDSCVDLVVTSPPYPGVYDYHAHHAARLRWLDLDAGHIKTKEIGAKRRLTAMPGASALAAWSADLERVLAQLKRVLCPGGHACLVLADTAAAGTVFFADDLVGRGAASVGLEVHASAAQHRPHFDERARALFAGRPKKEHVIVLRRPPAS